MFLSSKQKLKHFYRKIFWIKFTPCQELAGEI